MNVYEILLLILIVVVLAGLIIIRDAITVDGAKTRAALGAFGARIAALFKRGA